MSYVRRSVANFARAMEETLKENEDKSHWGNCQLGHLHSRLHQEMQEVDKEYYRLGLGHKTDDVKHLRKELTDVANFCMMLWENLEDCEE